MTATSPHRPGLRKMPARAAEEMNLLPSEVFTLITSPYPISLRALSLAVAETKDRELSDYVDANPCVVEALAMALLEALSHCPFALGCMERFARIPTIREVLLRANKGLFDYFLRSALKDTKHFMKFSPLCLSLLSTPLPARTPTPAKLTEFFLRVVEYATKRTDGPALRAVYQLLSNGLEYLVEQLGAGQRSALVERLNGFLAETDMGVFMYAMGTLARLYSLGVRDSETCASDEFFDGKKSKHLLPLVCGFVLKAVSEEDGAEIIKVAKAIIAAVSTQQRNIFLRTKVAEKTLASVWAKLERMPGRDMELVASVVDFARTLFPEAKMPKPLMELVCKRLEESIKEESLGRTDLFVTHGVPSLIVLHNRMDLASEILKSSLSLSTTSNLPIEVSSTARLQTRLEAVSALQTLLPHHPPLQEELTSCLLRNDFSTPLKRFLTFGAPKQAIHSCTSSSPGASTCESTLINAQATLHFALKNLVIQAVLLSSSRLPSTELALELLTLPPPHRLQCTPFPQPRSTGGEGPIISVLELPRTQSSAPQQNQDRDWRSRLSRTLADSASRTHESLIVAMGEVCRDLESRCEDVEKPLRQLEKQLEETKRLLGEQLEAANQELEAEKESSASLRDILTKREQEISKAAERERILEERMDEIMERAEESNQIIKTLKKDLETVREELEVEAQKRTVVMGDLAVERHKGRELEGEKKELEEMLRGAREDLESLGRELYVVRREKEDVEEHLREAEAEGENLTAQTISLNDELAEKEKAIKALKGELQIANEGLEELQSKLSTLEKEFATEKQNAEDKIADLTAQLSDTDAALSSAREQIAALVQTKSDLEEQLATKSRELEETSSTLTNTSTALSALEDKHSALQSTHTMLQSAHTTLQTRFSALKSDLTALKKSTKDLSERYKRKSAQLSQLQGLHAQLSKFLQAPAGFPSTPAGQGPAGSPSITSSPAMADILSSPLKDVSKDYASSFNSQLRSQQSQPHNDNNECGFSQSESQVSCTPQEKPRKRSKKDRDHNEGEKQAQTQPVTKRARIDVPSSPAQLERRRSSRRLTVHSHVPPPPASISRAATIDSWKRAKEPQVLHPKTPAGAAAAAKTPARSAAGGKTREMSAPPTTKAGGGGGVAVEEELEGLGDSFFSSSGVISEGGLVGCSTPRNGPGEVGGETTIDF